MKAAYQHAQPYRYTTALLCAVLFWQAPAALANDWGSATQPEAVRITLDYEQDYLPASYAMGGDVDCDSGCKAEPGCGCGKATCDCATLQALNKAVAGSHQLMFYDNNFDYLCDPCYCDWQLGDNLKRLAVGNCITVDVGGQYRMRYQGERNIRNTAAVVNRLGLTGADGDFLLHRTRLYVNAEVGSRVRFYGEMLDAASFYEGFRPRPIEENRAEMQNLFLDVVALETDRGSLTARVGRQELVYGAQRLISPLDWANTRLTFEGAKLMWRGENWDIDSFWVRPMRREVEALDPPNLDSELYGIYSTYKALCRDKIEFYWLALDLHKQDVLYDTIGSRYYGGNGAWLYEIEAGVQFGQNTDKTNHSAGFWTMGLGRKFESLCWQPTVWFYYDWASGDDTNTLAGNGFHHYLPLAHKYLGFMDLYGRRNIEDANVLVTMTPHEKVKLLAWCHFFQLQDGDDVPYNVTMSRFAGLDAGTAGSRELGTELDLTATLQITPRMAALLGYSHFFAGDFYGTTVGVPYDGDASFFYSQFHVNF